MQTEISALFSALLLDGLPGLCPYTALGGPSWFPKLAEDLLSHEFSLCCTTPPSGSLNLLSLEKYNLKLFFKLKVGGDMQGEIHFN